MPIGLSYPGNLKPVSGIRLAAASAGIYPSGRADVMLIAMEQGAAVSAVFTKNAFAAAPVSVARDHIGKTSPKYCLVNAGNANAGTGKIGISKTLETCIKLAEISGCRPDEILPFSTGVIGQDLPSDKICGVLTTLYRDMTDDAWLNCAKAIMTTDTLPKGVSKQITIEGCPVTVTGIAKGAGMIRPDMATMLAFIATDANIEKNILDEMLMTSMNLSFNRICIDGDMSTNDACVVMASGKAEMQKITSVSSAACHLLQSALNEVCILLAQSIVRDGEGITKFVTVTVEDGKNSEECQNVAYAIATSPLVKTAFFASDPNWGRILAAVGRSGIRDLDITRVCIYLNDVTIVTDGSRDRRYSEEQGKKAMSAPEIHLRIVLNRGTSSETVWTTDFSYEYVRINAEYRS